MTQEKPRIVIAGAGAMGVLTGYHLSLAGAGVAFLVRPGRASQMPSEYRLYSYDDAQTHSFGGYSVLTSPAEITAYAPEFVVLTLDGASLVSNEGTNFLAGISDAIRASDTTLIVGSVGIGLRESTIAASGLSDDRVVGGMIALVVHKADIELPAHPPTDPIKLGKSDFAYRHLNEGGFLLEGRGAAARFAEVFDRSGIAKCFVASPEEFGVQTRGIMPVFAASEILNWPASEALFSDPLWPITVEAVREVQGLSEHGEAGKKAAAELTTESLAGIWNYLTSAALPLDWQAFNAYHHGNKVNRSDLLFLKNAVERGEAAGHEMSAVRELLGRLEKR